MTPEPGARTLPELLMQCAGNGPDREALVAGTQRFTYAKLADEVAVAAAALAGLGVGAGDCVALLAPNIAEWIVIALGAHSVGARVDAFNTWAKAYDLDHLLSTSQAKVLITVDAVRNSSLIDEVVSLIPELAVESAVERRGPRYPSLRHVVVIGGDVPRGAHRWAELTDQARAERPDLRSVMVDPSTRATDIAYVVYTSGSTKHPKAVPLAHRNLVVNGFHIGERMGLVATDRIWFGSPLFWSFGCANALMATLTHQACFLLQEQFEPIAAVDVMSRERATAAYLLPAMTDALARNGAEKMRALEHLRTGVTIGRADEVERAAVTLGVHEICNVYGATENYGNCCVTDRRQPLEERLHTQGRPLPGVEVRVVDPDTGAVLPPGSTGELHVRGRIMPGYLNDEAATAAAITSDGWYRSGDRMTLNKDGSVTYIARLTDMIKTAGINVSPAEVESFLATHPDIAEVVVLGAPHPTRDQVAVAFVVSRRDSLTADEVIDYCRRNIAGYKVPWAVSIVASIPKTVTGKLARRNLLDAATALTATRVDQSVGGPR